MCGQVLVGPAVRRGHFQSESRHYDSGTYCCLNCRASFLFNLCLLHFIGLVPEQENHSEQQANKPVHLGHCWPGEVPRTGAHLLPIVRRCNSRLRHHGPGLVPEGEELGTRAEENAGLGDNTDDSGQQD